MRRHSQPVTALSLGIGCVAGLIVLLSWFGPERLAGYQAGQDLTISVNNGRPLAEAIKTIQDKYGWVITYEDPPYEYGAEIEDVASLVRRKDDLSKKVLVPKGGAFFFSYPVPPQLQQPADPAALLTELLASYASHGLPGRFKLTQTGSVFHVVPTGRRNQGGQLVKHDSVLETRISLPATERTADELIRAVLRSISQITGTDIAVGTVPVNLLRGVKTHEGAVDEPARGVLIRTLGATQRRISWRLFFGPGSRMYVLNLRIVTGPAPTGQ